MIKNCFLFQFYLLRYFFFVFLRDRIYYRFREFVNDNFDFNRDFILFALFLSKNLFIDFLNENQFSKVELIVEKVFATNIIDRRRKDCCVIDTKGFSERDTWYNIKCV